MTPAAEADTAATSLVLAKGRFDPWGRHFHMSDNLGPYLAHGGPGQAKSATGGLRHLFPACWFSSLADGPDLSKAGLGPAACALLAAATYEDMYNGDRPMRAFVPTGIATDDADRYLDLAHATERGFLLPGREGTRMWSADNAGLHAQGFDDEPDMVERGMMGSGYTHFTMTSDGTASIEATWIALSDGSRLLGWALCWYNK